jgi:hypothetical protein
MPVRWSSTLASQNFDDSIDEVNLTKPDWAVAKELLDLFGLFVRTTTMMQADNYPTLNRTIPEYFRLISRLEAVKDGKDKSKIQSKSIREAVDVALSKMNEYFAKNDSSPTATVSDPRFKLAIFEHLWKNSPAYVKRTRIHFKEIYRKYRDRATKR